MSRRGASVGSLFATTSVVALFAGSASPARAACVDVSGTFSNPLATTIDGICITNRTFTGNVTNAGTITPSGVVIVNSRITTSGAATFVDSGPTLVGGISIDGTSRLISNNNTVSITGAVFTGGITNAGTITSTGVNGRGIIVTGTSTFNGGITNTGTITAVTGAGTAAGIRVVNTSTFSGGISNSGVISARSRGIVVSGGSTFSGGVTNSGNITTSVSNGIRIDSVTTFTGGVTNSGTISLNATASSGIFVGSAAPGGISTFSGDIANSGSITTVIGAGTDNGIRVTNVGTITGNVTNSGTIAARSAAVFVSGVTLLSGSVVNSGSISSDNSGGLRVTNFGVITGGVANNSGTIVSLNNSIYVLNGTRLAGGITNSGSLTSTNADGIRINNVTSVAGGIANAGTIAAFSAAVSVGVVSTFSGNITNSGSISSTNGVAISVNNVSTFSADIVNSGTLSSTLSGATNGAIHLQSVSTFAGGVTNSGAINSTNVGGVLIEGVSTFTGGISNASAGTISARTSGIYVRNIQSFGGGITNSGSISSANSGGIDVSGGISLFSNGVKNAGTITSRQTGILVGGLSTFSGGITNSGTIASALNAGINVSQNFAGVVTSFSGGITNLGTITAQQSGIHISGVSAFAGDVVNSGSIASATGFGITVKDVSNFSGGITNTGTIVANAGIFVGPGASFSGAVANTGNVTGLGGTAIDTSTAPNAVTINQSAGTITGAIKLSPFADVLNIFGGVVAGNIVGQGSGNTVNIAPGAGNTFTYSNSITAVNAVNVNTGTLLLQGTIGPTALTTVNSGAALAGTGAVGALTVKNGATFAPGSGTPGSSMTVNGSLAFASGALYSVTLDPSTASFANLTGAAALGGATVNASFANGSYISKQYTILTAGSVSGTFGSLANTNLPANFTDTLSYDATHAYLNLTMNFSNFGNGLSGNQAAVGNALISYFDANGGIPMVYGMLNGAGLAQASGELATGSQQTTFDAMSQFMGVMTDPFMGRGGGAGSSLGVTGYADEADANAYAATKKTDAFAMFAKAPPQTFEQRWNVWAAGFGGSQSTSGNLALGSSGTTSSVAGTAVGAEYLFSPNTIAGFALAGGGTKFSVENGGTGRSDLFQFGAYVRHNTGPAYISAALAYGWQDITTDRTVPAAGLDQLRARFDANAYSGRLEGGYRFVSPATFGVGITPYAAAQFVTFDLPSYAEQAIAGTNNFALAHGARDVTDVRTELGIRADKSYALTGGTLMLRGRFAWAHDYDPDRWISATFQALPGASFVVNGAAPASDSALTTASIEMKWRNGWSAAATFDGEFSNVTSSYAGKGVVRYRW